MGASIPFAYCSCYRFIYIVISSAVFYFSSCSDKVIFFIRDVFRGQVIISPQISLRTIKIYSKSTTTLLESFQEKRYFFLMSNETFFCNINFTKLTKMLISTTKHNFRFENLTWSTFLSHLKWDTMF